MMIPGRTPVIAALMDGRVVGLIRSSKGNKCEQDG
jgi:hypothetical protein